ncbi:hypothetical protein K432DRAFT_453695 [Lepidopterella palustris CBS 459.81]|uniref:Uncharacterized protein n=1 Tax=Lepidopterella palustris CBS 459.81 TaxID=1314670 RepID=A0A8E2E9Z4_9PEZI|nr:hypothetical protein K432DRAFT_453695 [Lepidopterella palustris CBS 459.81]
MSGFEVVGVLLGSFPLIISALEHWRESADVVENWFQIKQKYKKCRREMRIQEEFFRQNIEHYLLPLVVDEDELDVLISEPCGPRWKDPALEMRLRSRLPKAYDLYLETIEELAAVMQKLKEELGAGKLDVNLAYQESLQPGKPSVTRGRKARLEFEAQRIKFSFSQTARSKLFAEMAHLNGQLRDLLVSQERNYELVEKRASREESGLSKGLLDFWRHANRIFKLLQKAWCCSCQFYHGANLALRHRKSPDVDLRILFQFSETNIAPSPWTWQETRIRILETGRGNALTHGKALATVHQNASLKSQPLSFRPHGDASQKAFSAEYSVASCVFIHF